MTAKTTRIFNNGKGQAVCLPAEFEFDGDEVLIRKDELTGDVILSKCVRCSTWTEYFASRDEAAIPDEFMAERPLNVQFQERSLFEGEI